MRPTILGKTKATTPEEAFASKHAWLLRWALHFSQNDRAAAEDLVQESFVKLLLSWESLTDVDNIEPLLYSYLKYAHLTERRRGQHYSFQSLSTIDFDTLFIRLRMANESDQLKIQNELRHIVAYLLWRRHTAKFASVFLLRFFHSHFPEDIMQICLTTRHAVDLSLRYAREDIKSHLANPNRIQESLRPSVTVPDARHAAISTHLFAEEIQRRIFSAPKTACLSVEHLRKRYDLTRARPIDCDLLSHLVTCEQCLEIVCESSGLPPTAKRLPGDALGPAPRSRNTRPRASAFAKHGATHTIAESGNRLRDIYDHQPSGLMIAINGQVLAVRDIGCEHSVLKVDIHSIESLALIEILSEQGLTLLTFPVLQVPPQAAPVLTHRVAMSGGREVSLLVQFTTDGALIEATYDDPSFLIGMEREDLSPRTPLELVQGVCDSSATEQGDSRVGGRNLLDWIRAIRWRPILPTFAIIMAVLAATLSFWMRTTATHRTRAVQAAALLSEAVSAEGKPLHAGVAGVIHQRLSIQASSRTIEREVYRDLRGRRRPRSQQVDPRDLPVKATLEKAGVLWDDPLSASSFKQWHDRTANHIDSVQGAGTDLLTLYTTSEDPIIRAESLTVRTADFHPVKRSLELRDHEMVEIAELTYSVAPWNRDAENWFEPDTSFEPPSPVSDASPRLRLPLRLSEGQLDEVQLEVLLTLNHLHADTERLTVIRRSRGIEVKGVVETEQRKVQLASSLRRIPLVTSDIASYRDMRESRAPDGAPTNISAVNVVSSASPIEGYCVAHHVDQDTCRRVSYQLLDAATNVSRKSIQIGALLAQFSPSPSLTPEAAAVLGALLLADMDDATAAILEQEHALAALSVELPPEGAPTAGPDSLATLARRNLTLSTELTYAGGETSRPAEATLSDLARSSTLMRESVTQLPKQLPAVTTAARSHAPQP